MRVSSDFVDLYLRPWGTLVDVELSSDLLQLEADMLRVGDGGSWWEGGWGGFLYRVISSCAQTPH